MPQAVPWIPVALKDWLMLLELLHDGLDGVIVMDLQVLAVEDGDFAIITEFADGRQGLV